MRRLRPLLATLVALLFVGMQVGAQLHAFEHDGERLARPHGAALLVPGADGLCAVCASFAGGSHATPAPDHRLESEPPDPARVASNSATLAGTAPAYYQSRGPPRLL